MSLIKGWCVNLRFFFLLLSIVLAGCQSTGQTASKIGKSNDFLKAPKLTPEELVFGTKIKINATEFSGDIEAKIGNEYYSALGVSCFKLESLGTDHVQLLAMCPRNDGTWGLAPPVWSEVGRVIK